MDDLENYRATLLHYTKLCASWWWRHQMEKFSALLAFCAGNSPIPGEFPAQRPVTRNFDVFFDLRLNKRLSKLSWSWWSETPSSSLWPHRNDLTPLGELKQDLLSGNAQFGSKSAFFVPCDLEIWWMTLKNNRAPLLYYIKLCASFKSHMWFQTGVTVRKRLIRIQIDNFLSHMTLKFDGWPWKTIGHLFYVASSFMHHFIAMGEFKVNLQVENAQFGSKWAIYCPVWHWFFMRMTLRNNRAPLLCCFKLYASFHSYRWIKTKVKFQKRSIRVKIGDFLSHMTLKFDGWSWKTIGHLFYVASSFMHHFIAMSEFKVNLQVGNAQFGSKSAIYCPVWHWLLCGWPCETIGHLFYVASSFMHHFIAIGELKQKLYSGIAQFGSKLAIFFLSRVTLNIDWWPWKTIGHLFYATSSFVHHLVTIVEFNLELQFRNAQFGSKSTIFWASWTWNLNDDLERQ